MRRASRRRRRGAARLPELHFAPKAKQVIYLHMVGGPPQMDLYDYKPKMDDVLRQGPARLDPDGPAADHDDLGPEAVPDRAVEVQVRPARQERHVGLRAAALHGPDGRRHVLHPQHAHRGDQPRAGDHLHADRQPDHRPAVPGCVDLVRAGLAQRQPADVRRAGGEADEHRAAPGDLGAALVVGLPVGRARRGLVPQRRRPDPVHQQPAGRAAAGDAATRSTGSRRSTR